eukprot:1710885-Lingulodinium_polyedra.AAC.1
MDIGAYGTWTLVQMARGHQCRQCFLQGNAITGEEQWTMHMEEQRAIQIPAQLHRFSLRMETQPGVP